MTKARLTMQINKALALFARHHDPPTTAGNETVSALLLKQASRGNAAAQYRLACCYSEGNNVTQDETTASKWFESAADAGHVPAMFRLGQAYLHGDGVDRNRIRGLRFLLKAANRGSRDACAHLGICYMNGDSLPKRGDLAVKWLRIAANRGSITSMIRLSHCYMHGIGVEEDVVKTYVCSTVALARSNDDLSTISTRTLTDGLTDEQNAEVRRLSAKMSCGDPLDL